MDSHNPFFVVDCTFFFPSSRSLMEAIDELVQLADSMRQAAALLADEDVDESASSSKRPSTFLNVVALGNVVSGI